jgi:hypothetical protein
MRFATLARTTTLALYLAARPSGAGSAVVCTASGAVTQASPTVTLDAVNTTISGASVAGAQTLTLTSATGVTVGRRYLLGGAELVGGEMITVIAVSGSTVTLAARVRRAYASGATFQGTRLTVAITTASTGTAQRGMRVEWLDPDTNETVVIPFDVVRWTLSRTEITTADLRAADALFHKRVPAETWLPDVMETALDILTDDLGAKGRVPGGYAGAIELARAHAYLTLALLAESNTRDDATAAYLSDMRTRYEQERDRTLASLPYDDAQTGATTAGAGGFRGMTLVRG